MPACSVIDYDCWYDILTFNSLHLGHTKLISHFWFAVQVNFSWADVISIQCETTVLSIILRATRCIILHATRCIILHATRYNQYSVWNPQCWDVISIILYATRYSILHATRYNQYSSWNHSGEM